MLSHLATRRDGPARSGRLLHPGGAARAVPGLDAVQAMFDQSARVRSLAATGKALNRHAAAPSAPDGAVAQREGESEGPAESGRFIAESTPGEGQLGRTEFLESLRARVFEAANGILAEIGQTAEDCPYLVKWFSYYASQDATHIERAVEKFAPGSREAGTTDAFMDAIVARVKKGLENHVETGSVDDVPEEIMEERPRPDDFEHIAEEPNPTAQLSRICSWCGSSGDKPSYERVRDRQEENVDDVRLELASASESKRKGEFHSISQGGTAIAQPGDRVQNAGTTSCGLVIAFGDRAIGCFHWPFMTDSRQYFSTFDGVVEQVGKLNRIEIITNDYPESSRQHYLGIAGKIRKTYGVPTGYYVHPGELRGNDPLGTLGVDHFQSVNATEERS